MNWRSHLCSVHHCHGETVADLVLSERQQRSDGSRVPIAGRRKNHLYLCEKHYEEMKEFLDLYEGGN